MSTRKRCDCCGMSTWTASGTCGRCTRWPVRGFVEWEHEHDEHDLAAAEDAIADTHAKRGDVKQAPSLMSGGGAEGNRTEASLYSLKDVG